MCVAGGPRDLELEKQPPPELAGSGHTDHAPSAAAAPAPGARAGTVAKCVKAQDSAHAVSDQHHLIGESGAIRRTDAGLQRRASLDRPRPLTCPQKPAPSDERRKAA